MKSLFEKIDTYIESLCNLERLGYFDVEVINKNEKNGPVLSYTQNGVTKIISVTPPPGSTLEDYLSLSV